MKSGGRQCEERIAGADLRARQQLAALRRAHDKAGQVILRIRIESGHLGRFAADQGAAVGTASTGDAGDDRGGDAGIQLSHREIVEEEQGPRALHGDIVHAVIHQVFPHRVVPAGEKRDLKLGADAVGRAHQHRAPHPGQLEARAERANIGQHAAGEGAAGELLDRAYRAIGFVDIDAGIAIAQLSLRRQISV